MSTFTKDHLSLEERAKSRIRETLTKYGCKVEDISIDSILSLKRVDSDIKKVFKEYEGSKFDLLIARAKTGEFYLGECKGKTRERYRNVVNINSYDVYYKFVSLPFPFLYFVWIEKSDRIYRHTIVDPKNFERSYMSGHYVYLIPYDLLHVIKPDDFKRLDAWLKWNIGKKDWLKQIWEALS